jgi:NAD(P)-dependent dehydrogenase (short-subunit alcohol dehydrogenase family)
MDLGLADATAVVQGGTSGMGRATARCFAEDGARVAVMARTQATIDETCAELAAAGSPDVLGLCADMTDAAAVDAAFAQVGERWGSLNILVNAAGPSGAAKFDDLTDDAWMRSIDEGCLGMVRCVRAALPFLRQAEWARIVNVSAHSVKRQSVDLVAYTAAKAAMTSVSKNLSLMLAPDEILVNTVSPGSFATPALGGWVESVGGDPSDLYAIMRLIDEHFHHPAHMPRAGDPSEMGPVIAFLASKRNSYMTGANVNVDGGSDFC